MFPDPKSIGAPIARIEVHCLSTVPWERDAGSKGSLSFLFFPAFCWIIAVVGLTNWKGQDTAIALKKSCVYYRPLDTFYLTLFVLLYVLFFTDIHTLCWWAKVHSGVGQLDVKPSCLMQGATQSYGYFWNWKLVPELHQHWVALVSYKSFISSWKYKHCGLNSFLSRYTTSWDYPGAAEPFLSAD